MKKSNRLSFFYIFSCLGLLVALVFGGCYGIYVSVGLNFVRSSVSNLAEGGGTGVTNVSYGGTVNFDSNMTGVIILSIILVVLSVLDLISFIKQIALFKQFKMIKNLKITQKIEKKNGSKGAVVFFAVVVDILSFAAGVAGIFVNLRAFNGGNYVFLLYFVDATVAILSVVSIVLLIVRYKKAKKYEQQFKTKKSNEQKSETEENKPATKIDISEELFSPQNDTKEIDKLENRLLKLKYLRSSRLISEEEFLKLREKFLSIKDESSVEDSKPDEEF